MDVGEPLEVVEVELPSWPAEAPSEAPERREDQPVPAPA